MAGQLQTETLIEGMNRLGCVAANVTERELAVGVEEFQKLAAAAQFALISANIVYQSDGSTVFPPVVQRSFQWRGSKPLRVGILGLTRENPGFLGRTSDGRRVILDSPVRAAARHVPALRESADVVILLANLPPSQVDRILSQVRGIDLVLAGSSARISSDVGTPPLPTVVYGGDQGKRVGEVRLYFGTGGLVQVTTSHLFLDRRYPFDPVLKEFEDKANVRINDYYRERAEESSAASGEVPLDQRYVGSSQCGKCHEGAVATWEASGHADAIETLIEAQQEFSPLCVGCHVTGESRPGGFRNVKATPELANVHCEACHGPGGTHLEDTGRPYGAANASGCLVCHTTDNSPDFDFVSYWKQIEH